MTVTSHEHMNNKPNNEIPELSEAELLEMIDSGKDMTHGYDELLSRIMSAKSSIVPDEGFVQKLVSSLPSPLPGVSSVGGTEVKSPYTESTESTERFAWFSVATLSSWKVVTPLAVVVLVFGVMIGRHPTGETQYPTPMHMAVNVEDAGNPAANSAESTGMAADTSAPPAQARMMMTSAKMAPAPSSADDVIALLSSEADADASMTTSISDISLLSIDPSSVSDLNQTYDAATN